ncbi:MAG: hypothetical protein OEV89_06765 [Desulfobulbaceae bacterium]|nr:hypothetical protein [Desulfobulbaceae bacterium]HIJ90454.1 hypothetical protein [Deltaproteobacteria bacterium]
MNLRLLLLFIVFCVALPGAARAKEVRLKQGEVYSNRDLVVICEGSQSGDSNQTLKVHECQYWDDFAKKCHFEKIIHSYNDLECVEECQHWDSFNNRCEYRSKCTFYPRQEAFILTTCADFDDYSRKCLKIKEEKISAGK